MKKGKRQSLVSQYLENVSRKALEEYQDVVRNYVRGRHGIYVLYRRDRLYYVGLASNLRNRLKAHLKDRHGASWDRFSVYLTIQDGHIRELESLALRILKPVGNRVGGKFARAENLRTRLAREIRELERGRLREIMGIQPRAKPPNVVRKTGKISGAPVLAKYVNRPTRLRRRYKGKLLTARVRSDGSIRFAGEVFNSPSLAGRAAVGGERAVNGWHSGPTSGRRGTGYGSTNSESDAEQPTRNLNRIGIPTRHLSSGGPKNCDAVGSRSAFCRDRKRQRTEAPRP